MELKVSREAVSVDDRMFARYTLVGIFATCVHYGVLWSLVEFAGSKAGPAAAVGATFGALTAYGGNRRFTFMSGAPHGVALPRFLLVAAFGVIASASIVWAGTEWLDMHYLMAQVVATALILWTGFALNRRWTFA
jgi:putative flippase GtrA